MSEVIILQDGSYRIIGVLFWRIDNEKRNCFVEAVSEDRLALELNSIIRVDSRYS